MSSGYTYQFHNAFFFSLSKRQVQQELFSSHEAGTRLYKLPDISAALLSPGSYCNTQQIIVSKEPEEKSKGRPTYQECSCLMAAAEFRMLWSVCLQQIQITFCTCIGQHENITFYFAVFTINPHKLLMSEFRPSYFYMRNTGII